MKKHKPVGYSPFYGTGRAVPDDLRHTITGTGGVKGPSVHDKTLTAPRKAA